MKRPEIDQNHFSAELGERQGPVVKRVQPGLYADDLLSGYIELSEPQPEDEASDRVTSRP